MEAASSTSTTTASSKRSIIFVAHADQVVSIWVSTDAGDDKIDLSSVTASEYSSLEYVSIDGGDGDDQIIGTQWSTSVLAGDINRDGQVNGSDIAAFLNAITDIPDWKSNNGLTDARLSTCSMSIGTAWSITTTCKALSTISLSTFL